MNSKMTNSNTSNSKTISSNALNSMTTNNNIDHNKGHNSSTVCNRTITRIPKPTIGNNAEVTFDAISENESFARVLAASFVTPLDPTIEEVSDIKMAVSEAVTNSIVHGYECKGGRISMKMRLTDRTFCISIHDDGVGIPDIDKALEPLYTTKPEQERSGMGFSFMDAFMDELKVVSDKTHGTTIYMVKELKS